MIAASEPQEFVPFGREEIKSHPGNVVVSSENQPLQSESFLVHRFSQVNIEDNNDEEWWTLRECDGIEEELYVVGKTAVVSQGCVGRTVDKGNKRAGRSLHASYTMETPIKQALWCLFTTSHHSNAETIPSLCILDGTKISVFTKSGEDFLSPLQFKVASAWQTKYGLLLERVSTCQIEKSMMDSCFCDTLTTLFSLLHPIDEISPIIAIRQGGILSYMSDPCLKVVFTSVDPSLCLLYDFRSGHHSIWKIRKATTEECQLMCGNESESTAYSLANTLYSSNFSSGTNLTAHKTINKSNLGLGVGPSSSNNSGYLSRGSNKSLPVSPHHTLSPSMSRVVSPLVGNSPRHSPSTPSSVEARLGTSQIQVVGEPKPIVPDICLEYIWTDTQTFNRNGEVGKARKVFLCKDALCQEYLCYLVEGRLVCVRLGWTNQRQPDLIIGTTHTIPAKDATPIPAVKMLAVLEHNSSVLLYTGTTLVGKLHIAGVSADLVSSSYLTCVSTHIINSPFPKRSSLLSSTRVGDGPVFDDQVPMLSPVRQAYAEPNDTTRKDCVQALRDPVHNRFTVEFQNGSMFRFSLPEMSSSPLVGECLRVLKHVLQKDIALHMVVKWYSVRNAPGTQDISPKHEWFLFIGAILDLLGYQLDSLELMQNFGPSSDCDTPAKKCKKRRASDLGSQEDWEYLLKSEEHERWGGETSWVVGIEGVCGGRTARESSTPVDPPHPPFNTSAPLFPYIHLVLFSLHLLYEELKLNTLLSDTLPMMVKLLHQLSTDLRLANYAHYYWRDYPEDCPIQASFVSQVSDAEIEKLQVPTFISPDPPSVFGQIYSMIRRVSPLQPYPYINSVNPRTKDILQVIGIVLKGDGGECEVREVTPPGSRCESPAQPAMPHQAIAQDPTLSNAHRAVLHMASIGLTSEDLSTLPGGVGMVVSSTVQSVTESVSGGWPSEVYSLVGRRDMLSGPSQDSSAKVLSGTSSSRPSLSAHTDHTHHTHQVLKLRFSKDERVEEVERLLESSEPVTIAIQQRPEVSDHEFIEEQERHLYAICTRTMALPVGRGMMELHTARPVISEPLAIPRLCLSGRAPPRGTTVELSHIEVVPNMNLWPLFHNGVAAGLRIDPRAPNIGSTWISYNKPKNSSEALPEHAGFLMALGLSGHLNNFEELNLYDYLTKCHEMTSVGLLLGLAASKRGTMDVRATKLLSVHIESLLPPTSIELDLVQNIQVAALLGIGLLYQATAHRHIAQVLLSEIGRPPGPEMDNSSDRECYALGAGLGLGLVILGRGANPSGLDDLAIADTLHYYMVGGHKRQLTGSQKEKYKSPSYQIREGDCVNNNVTAPGATLALGMMYFNTGNLAVANWLEAPDSEYMLDFVCPDLLVLRMVARGLILWDQILPTRSWVDSHVPASIRPYCLVKPRVDTNDTIDYETMNQAYCNIIAGACMAVGLRFAGSANNEAFTTLLHYCKTFTSLSAKSIAELAGKSTIETCINVILLSLAMVMAGTGELEVVRLCRHLRSRVGQLAGSSVVTYGSQLATHMALGLLFLGGGSLTLSTSPASIAALIAAFFPRFPTHSNDNRYHLQAFRHLYVLAVEPRLLLPKDIESGSLCYAHLTLVYLDTPHYSAQTVTMFAPCLLPELHLLKEVKIEDNRYWPVVFARDTNWNQLVDILKGMGCVGVKQRAGCLPYLEDPHGFRTLLAQTLSSDSATSWQIPTESIVGFTSDRVMLNYTKYFLETSEQNRVSGEREVKLMQALSKLAYESITRDKLPLLKVWIVILEGVCRGKYRLSSGLVWQLKVVLAYGLAGLDPHISPHLIHSINYQLQRIIPQLESEIGELVRGYMKGRDIAATGSQLNKLASYLTFYDIPLRPHLASLINQGPKTCFEFFNFLKQFNVPTSTVKKLWQLSR